MSAAPSLILSLQGERADRFGGRREQVFDCRDGSIGRSEECDWVLGAEGVSRLHALVRYLNGIYFIEDRSTNGMLLNGAPLRKGDPAALKQGDRLQIDTFELSVRLSGEDRSQPDTLADPVDDPARPASAVVPMPIRKPAPTTASAPEPKPAAVPAQNKDPLDLSLLLAPQRAGTPEEGGEAEGLIPNASGALSPGSSLDPLALFDAPSSWFDEPPPSASSGPGWNHTPAVADRFRPPQPEAARVDDPVLPEDWDATGSRVAPRPEPVQSEPSDAPIARPESLASVPSLEHKPLSTDAALVPASVPRNALASVKPPSEPAPASADGMPSAEVAAVRSPAVPVGPTQPAPAPASASAVTVPPAASVEATPEVPAALPVPATPAASPAGAPTQNLDAMFHIAVDVMMDVLRARAELKNSFRLPATLIQRSENNPLKFAPTAQEAVRKLLAPPDGGFLSGSAALDDAAADIRNHQMAMLAGVRSAFQSMLAHFDPARIEQETEGSARRLTLGGRPRHWERYKTQFEEVTRNPDECFRSLFGDEFARAYEEQLGRLKSRRN